MNGNFVGALAVILALLVGGGTFIVYDRLNTLKTEIEVLKLSIKPVEQNLEVSEEQKNSTSTPEEISNQNSEYPVIKIPTAILLPIISDPSLKPTTSLNLTIPEISRNLDGTLVLQLKVFTDKALGYTALNPKDIFSIVNLEGDDTQAYEVKGQFNSMPAKSSTSGSLFFQTNPTKSSLILKIKMNDEIRFYELDFKNKTYKETVIG
jgi:hypothetical protein